MTIRRFYNDRLAIDRDYLHIHLHYDRLGHPGREHYGLNGFGLHSAQPASRGSLGFRTPPKGSNCYAENNPKGWR